MSQRHDHKKRHGVHYTPPQLASLLARVTYAAASRTRGPVDVLDPACGDGALLFALARAVPRKHRERLNLCGFEQNQEAAEQARQTLAELDVNRIDIQERDFLQMAGARHDDGQCDSDFESCAEYDVIIANPPYVRTQVLGAKLAQRLGKKFGLTGRVDLYHAFSIAMASVLRDGGVLGLLTSNRFLTIKSGIGLRRYLKHRFQLLSVFDLGDTKLFRASVLPVIVVARKGVDVKGSHDCRFRRVYEHRRANGTPDAPVEEFSHVLAAVERDEFTGLAQTETGLYRVETGVLACRGKDQVWALSTPENADWLASVGRNTQQTFADVAQIRVGIKTTADAVFIREDWDALPEAKRPEAQLIHPLITHHDAARWIGRKRRKSVLYPHESRHGVRSPVSLDRFPKAASYLESHADRLRARRYVIDGGRKWFEIWVPHHPDDWRKTKVVAPDISERPTFFLDESDAIVNGDCYWITLKPGFEDDWLYLILGVANSSFVTKYYDVSFHNKLYSGRRRFMTQYVKQFPLPDLASAKSQQIVREVKQLLANKNSASRARLELSIESLVWESFGFGWRSADATRR